MVMIAAFQPLRISSLEGIYSPSPKLINFALHFTLSFPSSSFIPRQRLAIETSPICSPLRASATLEDERIKKNSEVGLEVLGWANRSHKLEEKKNAEKEKAKHLSQIFDEQMTPREAFRMISHKFHGKGPGKMKQEKRMKQYQEELKLKQMKNSDTPSLSVDQMREAQVEHFLGIKRTVEHGKYNTQKKPKTVYGT
ncbi:SART-1 family protein DOT2 [Hevea brasiliensis]|uniref:SART-1 family protein DOT2 n=1 Tax=Hevea brasiliensis TaxID=3981 RepID=UPI002600C5F0|nr:SART-1 family protein DOT2 [Hevea brasiliensis]